LAVHFVGFKDERVYNALKVFGKPDFWHRFWDLRAVAEVVEGDTVIFATGNEYTTPNVNAFDDSANQ
jgi:hypothetical protein